MATLTTRKRPKTPTRIKEPVVPTLKLRFPGGRYHATPWGHHVNEGLIEWPPSPWRLLRALVACGFSSQGWKEVPEVGRQLVNKLATVLPSYRLPDASAAHSRHFMPVGVLAKGREQTTLVFDTWANVGKGELFVHWHCDLNEEEKSLLEQLAAALGYLGRSESWVEAELTGNTPAEFNAFPHQEGQNHGRDYEQISLMTAIPPEQYREWQRQQAETVLAGFPLPEGNRRPPARLLRDRERAVAPFPPDLLACLTKDTEWWKGHGWSQPPGSQRVLYWRRSDALQVGVPTQLRRPSPRSVQFMLLALTTPSGNRAALAPVTRTLPQAELFHQTIVANTARGGRVHCPELIGKDESGTPLHDHHDHAHTVPLALNDIGRIDHILIYCKQGLSGAAQLGIRRSRETWQKKGPDLQVAVVGSGSIELLRKMPSRFSRYINRLLGPPGGSRVWRSATPFVPPRFLKSRGKNSLVGQINAELVSRRLPEVAEMQIEPTLTADLRHYIRRRARGGTMPPVDMGYGLRLTFAEPMVLDNHGPLLLGYASHYGLGLFESCET